MKPAASVITARRAGATAAFDQINKYFSHCQISIVSSTYWSLAYGMKPEQIEQDAEGIHTKAVMAAYDGRCCITGMTIPQMLTASQIKPYSVSDKATELPLLQE
ncbi:MAG: hypothetical protein SOR61_04115 [Evtepia sp.]|uniref:hypothetical protein n=1 Tax=Evtepia sp. TaxID=2773933 RepID=UPI002A75E197|nr:hypothetical protein [Evtepia sp.]MDY3014369.1 hypothetical protein [Evtepia sp.]